MKPPVWLLDVDGVLNAQSAKPPRSVWPADAWLRFAYTDRRDGTDYPVLVAQPVVDFVRCVHDAGRAEIRWHTTWQDQANVLGVRLGLPAFPVHDAPEYAAAGGDGRGVNWWKLPAARRVVADEGRALLWTDDDARFNLAVPAARAALAGGRTLVVAPHGSCGLSRRQLREISEFLDLPTSD